MVSPERVLEALYALCLLTFLVQRRPVPVLGVAWFFTSMLFKEVWTHQHFNETILLTPFDWFWTIVNLAGLGLGLAAALAPRRFLWLLWAGNVFFSLLFWIDLLYLRYFDDLPGIYVLDAAGQGGAAAPSAWALRKAADLALFADLLPVAVRLLFWTRRGLAPFSRLTGLALAASAVVFNVSTVHNLTSERDRLLRLRFRNMAMVKELGVLNYHGYDVVMKYAGRFNAPSGPPPDMELAQSLVARSRRSIDAPSPYKGVLAGRNMLMIQLESVESFVWDLEVDGQPVMPFFSRLRKSCLYGELQDQSGQGRSSDGEFISLNSQLPPGDRPVVFTYPSNHFHGLPAILAQRGYDTTYAVPYWGSFWNCRYMSGRYGFQHQLLRPDFLPYEDDETIGWGLSDDALFKRLIPHMQGAPKPFYYYAVTLMGHHPYGEMDDMELPLKLSARFDDTLLGKYLQCCRHRDDHLRKLVGRLRKAGLWDNTVLVMFGDHDARIPDDEMALLSKSGEYDKIDKLLHDRVAVVIHCPGDQPRGPLPAGIAQVDLDATLAHLFGIPGRETTFLGLNMLGPDRRTSVVSKGGYALDRRFAVIDEGDELQAYRLSDHRAVPRDEKVPLRDEMTALFHLSNDILRYDLLPRLAPPEGTAKGGSPPSPSPLESGAHTGTPTPKNKERT